MKKLLVILVLLLFSCSKEEPKLEVFSGEAFAFQLDTTWELNSSARIKGFKLLEIEENYTGAVDYKVSLYSPANDTINDVDFGEMQYQDEEDNAELVIDVQIELDSTFKSGDYKLEYIVSDKNKSDIDTLAIDFKLEAY
ncbi:MAG: hypothetical protein SCALA702_22700 [Melioribacteraceae bacterium]|nr:MAG: hypothetical protein SCALA702_22700 [Melioribacteraceae bacterium]